MLGNFVYCNPTRLIFGENALNGLTAELKKYDPKVLLIYGGRSIKRIGLYDQVIRILKDAGKEVVEDSGVMPIRRSKNSMRAPVWRGKTASI